MENSKKAIAKTKAIGKLVEDFMSKLPSDQLKKSATSEPLIRKFLEEQEKAQLLGKCLKASFGGGGGNPAYRAKKEGRLSERDYQFLLKLVDEYIAEFFLIQTGWEFIQEFMEENLKPVVPNYNYPKSETEFFFEVLKSDCDNGYLDYLRGFKLSIREAENESKKIRNILWKYNDSQTALRKVLESFRSNFWICLAISALSEHLDDQGVRDKMTDYFRKIAELADFMGTALQRDRSSQKGEWKSQKWRDGYPYEGVPGGWRLLNQTLTN